MNSFVTTSTAIAESAVIIPERAPEATVKHNFNFGRSKIGDQLAQSLSASLVGKILLGSLTKPEMRIHRSDGEMTASLSDAGFATAGRQLRVIPELHSTPKIEPRGRISAAQKWTGYVEVVGTDSFSAVVTDETHPQNPIEVMEFSMEDISPSDLPLVAVGAAFYLTMGYIDSPDGQRGRFSTLRFARQPALNTKDLERIRREAERLVEKFQSV